MIRPGQTIDDLETPCLLVDLDRMDANIRQWQDAVSAAGAAMRPHTKTHKIPAIAHLQLRAGATGITVAKVAEAEVFAAAGCDDIFIAYPVIGPDKWARVAALSHSCALTVGVDSEVGARGLSQAARAAGTAIRVRVEIDLGMNRSGVLPLRAEALCRCILALPELELDGIFTYRSVYAPGAGDRTDDAVGWEEGKTMVNIADTLRAADIPIRAVSAGSTPTARGAAHVPGITEVRPGTYVFGDYMMAERGTMRYDDVALSILCMVVSQPAPGKVTIDGGSKTFSGDLYPAREHLGGYATAVGKDAYLESMSEEHGVVRLMPGVDAQIGDRIAFYPIHVCTAVNLSDELIGLRDGRVEQVWPIAARGKRT